MKRKKINYLSTTTAQTTPAYQQITSLVLFYHFFSLDKTFLKNHSSYQEVTNSTSYWETRIRYWYDSCFTFSVICSPSNLIIYIKCQLNIWAQLHSIYTFLRNQRRENFLLSKLPVLSFLWFNDYKPSPHL